MQLGLGPTYLHLLDGLLPDFNMLCLSLHIKLNIYMTIKSNPVNHGEQQKASHLILFTTCSSSPLKTVVMHRALCNSKFLTSFLVNVKCRKCKNMS